jgi:hypothetical protein
LHFIAPCRSFSWLLHRETSSITGLLLLLVPASCCHHHLQTGGVGGRLVLLFGRRCRLVSNELQLSRPCLRHAPLRFFILGLVPLGSQPVTPASNQRVRRTAVGAAAFQSRLDQVGHCGLAVIWGSAWLALSADPSRLGSCELAHLSRLGSFELARLCS